MDLKEAVLHALNGHAMLFLGSGFSMGAQKENEEPFDTAVPLARKLLIECGFTGNETEDLSKASDIYYKKKSYTELIQFMRQEYTAINVSKAQEDVANVNWQRVYTTNYDNVFELASSKKGKNIQSIVLSDSNLDYQDKTKACIHLNGYINNLNIETIHNEFKLTNSSYLTKFFEDSDWIKLFRSDLLSSKAIIFLGYSMNYDLDLKRIIIQTPQLKEKTFFITREGPESEYDKILLEDFGSIIPIGIDNFANLIVETSKEFRVSEIDLPIICFKTPSISSDPTKILESDEFNLLCHGSFDTNKLYHSVLNSEDYLYCIKRTALDKIIQNIEEGEKKFLIHSDLGNGKTIFVQTLAALLSHSEFEVYILNKEYACISKEIEKICNRRANVVIVIEDYLDHIELLENLKIHLTNQVLILSERSASNDVNYDKIQSLFGDFNFIDLNKLDDEEIDQLVNLFNNFGYWSRQSAKSDSDKKRFLKNNCKSEIKNLILDLLNSPDILDRFDKLISSLKKKEGYYDAIIFILISQICRIDLDLEDLSDGLESSKLNTPGFKNNANVAEFVDFQNYTIKAKSSIIAQVLLQKVLDSTLIVDTLLAIFKKLEVHANDKNIRKILKKLMMFTNIQFILNKEDPRYKYNLLKYYESLRVLKSCRDNPDFWLQYAIVKLSENEYKVAKTYFDDAYSFAEHIQNYDTFKIDNHYARYILENELNFGTNQTCIEAFKQAHSILMDPKHKKEVRYYPYRVAFNYYPFYEKFFKGMKPEEKQIFLQSCKEILHRLLLYQETTSANPNRIDVNRAKHCLMLILQEQNVSLNS